VLEIMQIVGYRGTLGALNASGVFMPLWHHQVQVGEMQGEKLLRSGLVWVGAGGIIGDGALYG